MLFLFSQCVYIQFQPGIINDVNINDLVKNIATRSLYFKVPAFSFHILFSGSKSLDSSNAQEENKTPLSRKAHLHILFGILMT